jgi:pteridine reductase
MATRKEARMKTALITGAGKRIGRGIAEGLLEEGYHVVLHAHSSYSELEKFRLSHPRRQQIIAIIDANLAEERGQEALLKKAIDSLSFLDLVVHNASAFAPKDYAAIDRYEFREMLAVNLEAPFFITQGLISLLQKATSPSVINIIDAMWERPTPKYSHYAVSKAGLAILTRALASELAPKIRVNAVAPGAILFQPFHDQETRNRTLERIPRKRLGTVHEIADAVIYLHEKAQYAAGEILVIDGGRSILP